jgi:hypothetical protein
LCSQLHASEALRSESQTEQQAGQETGGCQKSNGDTETERRSRAAVSRTNQRTLGRLWRDCYGLVPHIAGEREETEKPKTGTKWDLASQVDQARVMSDVILHKGTQ